ncbi:MAG: endolytic transglycosylase MltG [Eubacterium sp.]
MENFDFNLNEKANTNDIYFSNEVSNNAVSAAPKKSTDKKKKKKTKGVGSTYLFFIIVIIVSMIVSIYAIMCMNDILAITKTKSSVTVSFTEQVENSDDAIDTLSDNGLIRCKNFCKFFVKLRDTLITSSRLGGPYEAGVYYLNGKMGLEGMLITLQGATASSETVTLTFPEGYTVPEIVDKLSENDVCDKTALLSVIQSTEFTYSLVSDLKASDSVPYRLEGFLFPDTYEFYVDESAASTIKKFLENGDNKFTEEYRKKAEKLGYSTYEVMIIASIIQKEAANNDQMKTISAVIHNRLDDTVNFPTLGCQSTADYITNKVAPALSSTSAHTSEYYMTYYNTNNSSTVVGLPAGPICNPGTAAIEAALNPSDSSAKFFFHDTDGTMYTAKTYSEFKTKVAKYAPYLEY